MRSGLRGPAHQLAVRMRINNCTHGHNIMKGTKVQTLGVRAVAGVCMVHGWCMAGCLGHKNNYGHGCNY